MLEDYKRSVEKFKQEAAAAEHKLLEDENKLHHDEEVITELRTKIPTDERNLLAEKQEFHRAEGEKGRLTPEIAQLKRKQAVINNEVAKTAIEQNKMLRNVDARDPHEHGAQLKELKQKPRFGLN